MYICTSCTSTPEIPADMSQTVVLKNAQTDFATGRWKRALHYYQTALERYADDLSTVTQIEYEIAFIHYSVKRYDLAKPMFQNILNRYETESDLPLWTMILSEKILNIISEEEEKKAAKRKKRKKKSDSNSENESSPANSD